MDPPETKDRLESWKEIAGYLNKTVRTTQRWEAEGLPVHREVHRSRGYIFAFPKELDEWLAARQQTTATGAEAEAVAEPAEAAPIEKPLARLSWRWTALISAVIVIGVAGVLAAVHPPAKRPPVWLLIADSDNCAGDSQLDVLPFLLAREIGQSSGIYAVSRGRIEDTLRLMRMGPDTRVDEAVAREVCERDGGISLIVTSRVERSGAVYALAISLTEARSGKILASATEVAGTPKEIPASVRKLAAVVRRALGDSNAGSWADQERLQRVTTPSLSACQLYSRATRPGISFRDGEALARSALRQDSDFPSAHIWLAWMIYTQRGPTPEGTHHIGLALASMGSVTEREALFIQGLSLMMPSKGHPVNPTSLAPDPVAAAADQAATVLNRMVTAYPDDYWGRQLLLELLGYLGRYAELRECAAAGSDLRPNDAALAHQALNWSLDAGDRDSARKYGERARRLEHQNAQTVDPRVVRSDARERLHELWLDGQLEEIRAEIDGVARSLPVPTDFSSCYVTAWYRTLGRLRDSQAADIRLCPANGQLTSRVIESYARDAPVELSEAVREVEAEPAVDNNMVAFDLGLVASERDWNQAPRLQHLLFDHTIADVSGLVTARFAAFHGDYSAAYRVLAKAEPHLVPGAMELGLVRCSFARARELAGDDSGALEALQSADRGPVTMFIGSPTLWVWHRIRYERARILRKLGRRAEAEDIEASLRRELRLADPDHPILARLNAPDRKPFRIY